MSDTRWIIHVDMDAFYASIEERDHPELAGQPVIVGGPCRRGVVSASSYEARKYGITSAMPIAQALRLCPKGIFLPCDMTRYVEVSGRIRAIFESYTPVVEPLSLDEAFLDVTGSLALHGDAPTIGRDIKTRIRRELDLPASVGVAPNKFLAKLASDIDKPDGFVVVAPDHVEDFLAALPVERIPGVGEMGQKILHELGVSTIAQLRSIPVELLLNRLGSFGYTLEDLAHGRDDSPVVPDAAAKSIGAERTFPHDIGDPDAVAEVLRSLAENVGRRLRREKLKAGRVEVKVRLAHFATSTRSRTLREPTSVDKVLIDTALALLHERLERSINEVRLVGVQAGKLAPSTFTQLDLFGDPTDDKHRSIDSAVDRIRDRFGRGSIRRGAGGGRL